MTDEQLQMIARGMTPVIKHAIAEAVTPLLAKIALLESRPVVVPEIVDGVKDTVSDLRSRLLVVESRSLVPGPMGPAGKDGAPGRDGKDGAPGQPGEKGLDGAHGRDGKDGLQGLPGINGKDGAAGLNGKDGAEGPRGENGLDGVNGKDGSPGLNGKDGVDGINGKDGAPGPQGEKGIDGVHGKDGAPGPAGQRGEKGIDGLNGKDAVLPDITSLVKSEVGRWPVPKDGKSVTVDDLTPLVTTMVEKAVAALPRPVDPIGFTGALIERDGTLVLTTSDGGTKRVGQVVGKDGADGLNGKDISPDHVAQLVKAAVDEIPPPKDGKDGADGIGFDDLSVDFDEHKGFSLRCVRGLVEKSWPLHLPYYLGIWQSGRPYVKSAMVTAKGSIWIALKDTIARPGEDDAASRDWKLCVKGGRDGKPGKDGKDGGS